MIRYRKSEPWYKLPITSNNNREQARCRCLWIVTKTRNVLYSSNSSSPFRVRDHKAFRSIAFKVQIRGPACFGCVVKTFGSGKRLENLSIETQSSTKSAAEIPISHLLFSSLYISFVSFFLHERLWMWKTGDSTFNPHEEGKDSHSSARVLYKTPNWRCNILFSKDDEGKVANWLHSHVGWQEIALSWNK